MTKRKNPTAKAKSKAKPISDLLPKKVMLDSLTPFVSMTEEPVQVIKKRALVTVVVTEEELQKALAELIEEKLNNCSEITNITDRHGDTLDLYEIAQDAHNFEVKKLDGTVFNSDNNEVKVYNFVFALDGITV